MRVGFISADAQTAKPAKSQQGEPSEHRRIPWGVWNFLARSFAPSPLASYHDSTVKTKKGHSLLPFSQSNLDTSQNKFQSLSIHINGTDILTRISQFFPVVIFPSDIKMNVRNTHKTTIQPVANTAMKKSNRDRYSSCQKSAYFWSNSARQENATQMEPC